MIEDYKSFADKVHRYNCSHEMIRDLSHEEINALMDYQRRFEASLRTLYESMSPDEADKFIRPLLTGLAES